MNTNKNKSKQSAKLLKIAIANRNKKQNPNIIGIVNNAYNEYLSKEKIIIVPERPVKSEPSNNIYVDIQPVNLTDIFEQNK